VKQQDGTAAMLVSRGEVVRTVPLDSLARRGARMSVALTSLRPSLDAEEQRALADFAEARAAEAAKAAKAAAAAAAHKRAPSVGGLSDVAVGGPGLERMVTLVLSGSRRAFCSQLVADALVAVGRVGKLPGSGSPLYGTRRGGKGLRLSKIVYTSVVPTAGGERGAEPARALDAASLRPPLDTLEVGGEGANSGAAATAAATVGGGDDAGQDADSALRDGGGGMGVGGESGRGGAGAGSGSAMASMPLAIGRAGVSVVSAVVMTPVTVASWLLGWGSGTAASGGAANDDHAGSGGPESDPSAAQRQALPPLLNWMWRAGSVRLSGQPYADDSMCPLPPYADSRAGQGPQPTAAASSNGRPGSPGRGSGHAAATVSDGSAWLNLFNRPSTDAPPGSAHSGNRGGGGDSTQRASPARHVTSHQAVGSSPPALKMLPSKDGSDGGGSGSGNGGGGNAGSSASPPTVVTRRISDGGGDLGGSAVSAVMARERASKRGAGGGIGGGGGREPSLQIQRLSQPAPAQ